MLHTLASHAPALFGRPPRARPRTPPARPTDVPMLVPILAIAMAAASIVFFELGGVL